MMDVNIYAHLWVRYPMVEPPKIEVEKTDMDTSEEAVIYKLRFGDIFIWINQKQFADLQEKINACNNNRDNRAQEPAL